jgi:phosphoglycolate phosphatase-like HAD superfamily hydrolase
VAVVGDSPADVGMGRAAGAGLVVGVRSGLGSDQDLAAADLIIDSVGDLAEA